MAEMGQRYAANKGAAEVAFKVTTKQLRMLRDRIVEGASLEVRPSLQDCLTAYLVNVINRYIEVPITQLTNVASVSSSSPLHIIAILTGTETVQSSPWRRERSCRCG